MPRHNPDILASLAEYLNARNGGGGAPPGKQLPVNKTALDTTADIRDSIAGLVAGNYRSLKTDNPEIKKHAERILGLLPGKAGQDLLTHIIIQNQQVADNLNPTQRLDYFYNVNAANPEVQAIIQKAKAFGYGPLAGFRDSQDVTNQQLQGINPLIVKK